MPRGCRRDGDDWIGTDRQSLTFRFRYPEQETKLRAGSQVHLTQGGASAGRSLRWTRRPGSSR